MSRSFLQTPFWVKFKEQNGWKAYKVEDIWILGKNLFGNKSFLYAPEVAWSQVISHSERSEESPTNVGSETSSEILRLTPQNDNNHHKYTGITRFKEQFGGEKVQIVGSYDYVYKPTYYRLFKMAEKCRRK